MCAGLFLFYTPTLLFVRKARSGRRGKTGHDFLLLYYDNIIDEPFTHENGTVTPSCDALDHIFFFDFFFRHVALPRPTGSGPNKTNMENEVIPSLDGEKNGIIFRWMGVLYYIKLVIIIIIIIITKDICLVFLSWC